MTEVEDTMEAGMRRLGVADAQGWLAGVEGVVVVMDVADRGTWSRDQNY